MRLNVKILVGLFLLGFGGSLLLVFPNKVISQTITTYEEAKIVNPTNVYESPSPARLAEIKKSLELTTKAKRLVGKYGGSCVTFARNFSGATPDVVGGMAIKVRTNTTTPEVGEIIKTNESPYGHLGIIIAIDDDTLTVVDSNYGWDGIIHIRTINIQNPIILGYINL